LSADATRALELIRKGKGVNVGEVRRLLSRVIIDDAKGVPIN
jgi:hypothetical protein